MKKYCTTCQPIHLSSDIFEQIHHLPDPILDPVNEEHQMKFPDCYGKETSEKHMPSLTASNQKGHGITITCF